jgi:glyoxylase-like metal-dependent hydrolase (beta-lactamase superfamily II)
MHYDTKVFQIGEIRCIAVNDGTFAYAPNWFFANAPPEELKQELGARSLPTDQILSPFTCLLVDTGPRKVLVDTGAGNLAPATGELLGGLRIAGITPAEIDTVVLTHGHPDHIGGNLDAEGKPAFPNARYVMSKAEWDFWNSDKIDLDAMQAPDEIKMLVISSARRNLPPIGQQLDLVERETEVVPGVHVVPAPGHTPGHVALVISSGKEQLLHIADSVLHPIHLEQPGWQNVFDLAPDQAVQVRKRLLGRAVASQAKVIAYHFPFPGMGRIVTKSPHSWRWEPVSGGQ